MSRTIKRIAYTICIILICISDQRIASMTGDAHLMFSALPSLALGLLILFHYSYKDFLKAPYYILAALWLFLYPYGLKWGFANTYYHGQWIMHLSIIMVFSFVLLRTVILYFAEKQRPVSSPFLLISFVLMVVLIYTSRYDYKWTCFYILLFLFLYLTNFSKEDRSILLFSLQDGIIIAFFLIQGTAFMFRPYDTLRYLGQYANTNMNALFYQSVYCAFLSRFIMMESAGHGKKAGFHIAKWGYFIFGAFMWPFVLLTMCRSAMMGMGAATLLGFAYCIRYADKRRILNTVKYFGSLLLLMVLGFPVVYCAVRYLPPLFHHPVYYVDEYSDEKILYNDPWDSPKYTDWEDILIENFGRLQSLIPFKDNSGPEGQANSPSDGSRELAESREPSYSDNQDPSIIPASGKPAETADGDKSKTDDSDIADHTDLADLKDTVNTNLTDTVTGESVEKDSDESGDNEAEGNPSSDSTSLRLKIYNYYFHSLNINGHKEAEHGLQLPDNYFAPHAHNLLLQLAFNFGIPFGIIFVLFIAATGIKLLIDSFRGRIPGRQIIPLMFFGSIIVFGMTEVMWRNGQISYTLLFLLPFFAWQYQHRVPSVTLAEPLAEDASEKSSDDEILPETETVITSEISHQPDHDGVLESSLPLNTGNTQESGSTAANGPT